MSSLIKGKSKTIIIILIYIIGLIIPSFSQPIQTLITYTEMQWSTPELISNPGQNCYQPSIIVDNSNKISVIWPTNRVNLRYLEANSSTWSDIQDVSTGPGVQSTIENCLMIQDQWENMHLCWLTGMGELCYRYSKGLDWSHVILVKTISQYDFYSFASLSDGSTIFIWSKSEDSVTQLFSKYYSPIYKWSSEYQITYSNYNSIKPVISVDSNDLVHLIWLEEFEPRNNASVYYKTFNLEYEFSNESKISSLVNTRADARLIADNFNNLHAVWEEKDGYTFKLAYRKNVNNTWLSKIFINPYYADNPAIFCDSSNVTHFTWYEGNSLKYLTINQTSHLSEMESAVLFCGGTHPELVVDSYGNVHIVYLADPYEYTLASPPTEFGINYIVRKEVTLTTEPTTIAIAIPLTAFILIIYFGFSMIITINRKFRKKS
jgi:hypothetical protein